MPAPTVSDPAVAKTFSEIPAQHKNQLIKLRELIFKSAEAIADISSITECLKWGQPSYIAKPPGIGSTVRLGVEGEKAAVYFICSTNLLETFKSLYPDTFQYSGNRAILFGPEDVISDKELSHCIAMALTYHKRKSRS